MGAITFQGIDNGTTPAGLRGSKAFPLPGLVANDSAVYYDWTKIPGPYSAYLVQVTDLTADTITFVGINKSTGVVPAGVTHKLHLGDFKSIWPGPPSTLDGWSKGTTDCAIIFLSDAYAKTKINSGSAAEDMTDLAAAFADPSFPEGDPNKWPEGAEELRLHSEREELKKTLKQMIVKLDEHDREHFTHKLSDWLR
jgi:hypothetical protein